MPPARDGDRLTLVGDGSGVRRVHPGEDLDEGGLACAVVADDGDDLARVDVESTPLSACTAPKLLLIPRMERTGSPCGFACAGRVDSIVTITPLVSSIGLAQSTADRDLLHQQIPIGRHLFFVPT